MSGQALSIAAPEALFQPFCGAVQASCAYMYTLFEPPKPDPKVIASDSVSLLPELMASSLPD